MRSLFNCEPNPTAERLRQETEVAFEVVRGAAVFKNLTTLRNVLIETPETKVAHGLNGVPAGWWPFSPQGPAVISETRPPDSRFLYLATDATVVTGLVVF
jgi:hypothetical protein